MNLKLVVFVGQAWTVTVASAGLIRGGAVDRADQAVDQVVDQAVDQEVTREQHPRAEQYEQNERDLGIFSDHTRIINGDQASSGEYPYAVSLSDDIGHFCGGSLIAPDMVLSAAHCAGGKYDVIINRQNLNSNAGEVIAQKKEVVHPNYNWKTTNNDYMIVYLEKETSENVEFAIVNDDSDEPAVSDSVHVAGWGDTQAIQRGLSNNLMDVEVKVISNSDCDASSGTIGGRPDNYNGQITSSMLCAKDPNEDACQGDSGGPLVVKTNNGDVQVGVVSWGIGCAHPDFPGVYSRVSEAYSWIRNEVCGEGEGPGSANPPAYLCGGGGGSGSGSGSGSGGSGSGGDTVVSGSGSGSGSSGSGSGTNPNWRTLVTEDFTGGYGFFQRGGKDASHYANAKNRQGVVRIQNGNGKKSSIESKEVELDRNYSKIRVSFEYYGLGMEEDDEFCLDCSNNGGNSWSTARCWNSRDDFINKVWYDDTAECDVKNDESVNIRFRCAGNNKHDDVLISEVKVEGQ